MVPETEIRDLTGRRTVAALFQTQAQVQQAIADLKAAGFEDSDIGVVTRDRNAEGELHQETGTSTAVQIEKDAVSGGLMGGLIGLLVGVGALAIPGIGPVIAGGIFSSVLGATAVGVGLGAVGGGLIGILTHLGLPEHEAQYFATGFHAGGTLVTVHAGERAPEAITLLERDGGDTAADAPR